LKLQRLQNRFLRYTGNICRRTPVCELHTTFRIPCFYDYINKLCREKAEVTVILEDLNVYAIEQAEAMHRKYQRFKFCWSQAYARSNDSISKHINGFGKNIY
jgi:hypothetical protein